MAVAAVVMLAAGADISAGASSIPPGVSRSESQAALDVPFMAQTQDLCGGAAVAMVFRYWGARGIAPEEFASLVRADAAGIPTGILADAVRRHGWSAYPFTGTAGSVRHHLGRGRPVIALIAIRPGRYHYVVVLAWRPDVVLVHDPAIGPARSLARAEFEQAWSATGRWSLLVLPAAGPNFSSAPSDTAATSARAGGASHPNADGHVRANVPHACAAALALGLAHARARQFDAAEAALRDAASSCTSSSAPWRELAGLALLRRQPADAAALASRAVSLEPDDAHAWRVLATSRFLLRDRAGALAAWNRVAEPRVDLVRIDGLARTRFRAVGDVLGMAPGRLLTVEALAHAERRLASLPTVKAARVGYTPVPGGLAEVDAALVERRLAATSPTHLAALGARALVNREVGYTVAGPTGAGEVWDVGWRFWEARPAVSGGVRVPVAAGLVRGVLGVTGGWEAQQYAAPADRGGAAIRQSRRTVRASLSDWFSSRLRWEAGIALDRWLEEGSHLAVGGSIEARLADDRVAALGSVQQWAGSRTFTAATGSVRWRSTRQPGAAGWLAAGTVAFASAGAPFDTWEGAGTGHGRRLLLRAHPLLEGGIVSGAVFGRRVAHATLERRQPVAGVGPLRVSVAGFVDAARHWEGLVPGTTQADAGAGLRINVPGEGVLRLDIARGIADGATAVSAGWQTAW